MNAVLIVFLSLSVSGSILALILMALKPFIKSRLSQTWQYYIWLIVILRFLLPFTPQVSVVGEMSRYIQNMSNPPAVVAADPGIDMNEEYASLQVPDAPQTSPDLDTPPTSRTLAPQNAETETSAQPAYWRDILNNIWLLWIGVALVLFVHKVASYRGFIRFVKVGAKKISDKHILDIYEDELAAAKIKRRLPLYVNAQVVSPMLVGIVRPALVIPVLEASDAELWNVFRHELTHYKRLDFLYKWIVQITLCLHWFNPLVYLINKQINKSCELSCDGAVIKHLDEDGRVTYGDALMASLKAQGNYSDFVASMNMSENGNIVKERLDMIMGYRKKSGLVICITGLLTVLLFCGFTFAGAYATDNISKGMESKAPSGALDFDSGNKVMDNMQSSAFDKHKQAVAVVPDNYGQIVKTLDGAGIQNINIHADWCSLKLEPASGNTFEAYISYPDFLAPNYEKHFALRMERTNNDTIIISTDYDNHGFDPVEGIGLVDTSDVSTLVIKCPEHYYNEVQLFLTGNQTIEFDIDASTLEVYADVGNMLFKTNKVFDNLNIEHDVGNFDLYLQELSKNMKVDTDTSNFTLNLPSNPSGIRLTVNNGDYSVCDLPATWNPSIRGNTVSYEHGNAPNTVDVNHRYGIFTVNTGGASNNSYNSDDANQMNNTAITDTGKIHANFSETSVAKNFNTRTIESGNFLSMDRIDVVDSNGFAYQGMVYICNGSDSYRQVFRSALERLNSAYPNSGGKINGYLDPIRDNRLRNYGDQNFSAIEKVVVANANGVQYDAYVIAVGGSEDFVKPFKEFWEMVWEKY